jgi:hypothetical protein
MNTNDSKICICMEDYLRAIHTIGVARDYMAPIELPAGTMEHGAAENNTRQPTTEFLHCPIWKNPTLSITT